MSLRPEHLEGILRRIAANERILRLMVLGQLVDLIYDHVDPEVSLELEGIYMSLSADKGEYVFTDFRNAVNEALTEREKLPEDVQHRIKVCFDYLFTPAPPV